MGKESNKGIWEELKIVKCKPPLSELLFYRTMTDLINGEN